MTRMGSEGMTWRVGAEEYGNRLYYVVKVCMYTLLMIDKDGRGRFRRDDALWWEDSE